MKRHLTVDVGVEKITTSKKPNLILNVDGIIGVAFVDLLCHSDCFTPYVMFRSFYRMLIITQSDLLWNDISYLLPDPCPEYDES